MLEWLLGMMTKPLLPTSLATPVVLSSNEEVLD